MKLKYVYIMLIACLILEGCFLLKETSLTIPRAFNKDNSIRLNGYYAFKYSDGIRIYFLYENGTVLYGSSTTESELANLEESYKEGSFYERVEDLQYYWGVYKIDGDKIQLNMWSPSDRPYRTFLKEGEITTDRTFRLTFVKWSTRKEVSEIEELYEFKAFSPKPDSTNVFIE